MMQELQTNKLNLAFKHPSDLCNIKHVAKYASILFIIQITSVQESIQVGCVLHTRCQYWGVG